MKTLMILGAGYTQIPLIRAAKRLGYRTAVTSIAGDYPGFDEADEVIYADLCNPKEVAEKAVQHQVDGAATCGLDLAMRAIGAVSEMLQLPGPSRAAAEKAGNKLLMKQALTAAGVQTARWMCVHSREELEMALDSLPFPVIVKAVDLMGSRGIFRCDSREEARENYKKTMEATGKDYCLVEEFIEGTLFGVEGMISRGQILFLLPNNTEAFYGATPSPVGHSVPFEKQQELGAQAMEQTEKAIRALGLDNCPINCDLIYKDGKIYIVELTGRSGATGLSEMVSTWYGIDYYETIVKLAMGEDVSGEFKSRALTPNLTRTLYSLRSGKLVRLENRNPEAEDILDISFNVEPGEEINAYTNGRDRIGQVMIKGKDLPALRRRLETILGNIYLELEGDLPLPETMIQRLPAFDGKNRMYIKREDLLPFSFGGNKVRFARSFLEDMVQKGADGMIIYGNYHSNLCRILSAACRRKEIPCSMIHNVDDADPKEITANSYLIREMQVKEYPCRKGGIAPCVAKARKEMQEEGRIPYYIYGDDTGRGNAHVPMEAYVQVYREIQRQEQELHTFFDYIFLASSTNTTQSGLLAGMLLEQEHRKIIGISVSRNSTRAKEVILENLEEYFREKGRPLTEEQKEAAKQAILVEDRYLAGGYGCSDDHIRDTIRCVYDREGIYLDGTYTGKAFSGMEDWLREHHIRGKSVLFLHTGGAPLFFDSLSQVFGK